MKHSVKITLILLAMFLVAQLFGLFVVNHYAPRIMQSYDEEGNLQNYTTHDLPYGLDPPQGLEPQNTLFSFFAAILFATFLMFLLMKYKVEIILKLWFFLVVIFALAISFNSLLFEFQYASIIAFLLAAPLAFIKIFKRNIIVHNITELGIYPGIAAIITPLFNVWTAVVLLVLISLYDAYAVWHAGFMQKMAKYQIQKLKIFTGFFIPYVHKDNLVSKDIKEKKKKVKVSVAILGGGDVVFPIIVSGVALFHLGIMSSLLVSLGATASLALLFYFSEKGKFYPAMPFISAGCLLGLFLSYLL